MLDPVLGIALGAAALMASGAGVAVVSGRRSLTRRWREAAASAGLQRVRERGIGPWPRAVEGWQGSLRVEITASFHSLIGVLTHVAVHGLPLGIELRSELAGGTPRALRLRDIVLGDEPFDGAVLVTGEPLLACALLDAPLRKRLPGLLPPRLEERGDGSMVIVEPGARLERGMLVSERAVGESPTMLAAGLRQLLEVAQALQPPDDPLPRLLEHVREDPQPGVRRSNLLALLREFPGRDVTREAARHALEDGD